MVQKHERLYGILSGLSEPVGALIGYFIFRTLFNDLSLGFFWFSGRDNGLYFYR